MTNKLQDYLNTLLETNRTLETYVNWDKVLDNMEKHSIQLDVLNSLAGISDEKELRNKVNQIFEHKYGAAFESLEILIAKRNDKDREYLIKETLSIKTFSFHTENDVVNFILNTNLLELLKNIKSLKDYVFGVEVGMDTNGRKNRNGKLIKEIVEIILVKNKIDFRKKITFNLDDKLNIKKNKFGKVDFIFDRNGKTYYVKTSFFNTEGTIVSKSFNSHIKTKRNITENHKYIWLADGKAMKGIKELLSENWENTNIYNIKQFEKWLKTQ